MLGIFLDQETTGLDSYKHKVIEIALKIISFNSGEEIATYQSVVRHDESVWTKKDPASIAINGFSWEEIQRGKSEAEIRSDIIGLFQTIPIIRGKAVFVCQNPSFDRAFFSHFIDSYTQEKFQWPYHWLDLASMYWACEVQKTILYGRRLPEEIWLSKDKIAEAMSLPKEQKPHRAMQGVDHLITCYEKVVGFISKS
jgi:DNA polymerase III epsilon subunit-like protein